MSKPFHPDLVQFAVRYVANDVQPSLTLIFLYLTISSIVFGQIVANITGCGISRTEELVQCIRGKSQDELVSATKQVK